MSKIEIGRFAERLRRSLGMAGQVDVAGDLAPEISPVIVIQDNSAEWQFLQRVRLCQSAVLQSSKAANNPIFRYLNPAGSGVIAAFTYVGLTGDVDNTMIGGYGITQTSFGTAAATGLRDHRWVAGGTVATAIVGSRGTGVGVGLTQGLFIFHSIGSELRVYSEPFILLPGESFEFGSLTDDVEMTASLTWTERMLPALEE